MLYEENPNYDLWEIKVYVPFDALEDLENAFSTAEAVLTRLMEEGPYKNLWEFQVFVREEPKADDLKKLIKKVCGGAIPGGDPAITFVPKRDWLKENLLTFEPVSVGRYYIYGHHIKEAPPANRISLCLDAATAFGSGEHQTTQGCLTAIEALGERDKKVLDLGCGSGILAMAYAKTYPTHVDAVDMDEESVRVAKENVKNNGLKAWVKVWQSRGFEKVDGIYDIILANILARPLVEMAPDMWGHLVKGGYAVLSGFLESQLDFVIPAYEKMGFEQEKLIVFAPWCTVVMKKI